MRCLLMSAYKIELVSNEILNNFWQIEKGNHKIWSKIAFSNQASSSE